MSLYKQFKTDAGLERLGVVLQYGQNSKGLPIGIRIARAGGTNEQYAKRMEAAVKPYRRQLQNDTMDRKVLLGIVREVFCETVILGWENVEDKDGNALAFNKANAIKLFTDLPDLFDDVKEQSERSVLFREEVREVDAGN